MKNLGIIILAAIIYFVFALGVAKFIDNIILQAFIIGILAATLMFIIVKVCRKKK